VSDNHSGLDQTLADFDGLQLELASETKDWTRPLVVRTYDPDENGQEDYEDEAMLLEDHGYAHSSVLGWAGNPKEWVLTGTFSKDTDEGVSDDPDTEWYCEKCGCAVDELVRFCPQCGDQFADETTGDASPQTLVRTYKGRTQSDAAVLFSQEAPLLAAKGYKPISQSWADGRPGMGRVLMLGLAANAMRPDGTLTVTYERTASKGAALPANPPPPQVIASPGSNVEARLATLDRLRATGTITEDEYTARRNKILDEI
jgi:Short C-terminal domain